MSKSAKLNVVSAFTWLSNALDTQILSASEQLVLLHLVKYLNRNFWKSIKISNHMLAKAIGKDDRTVATAIKKLVSKNLVIQKGGEIHIGIEGAEKYFSAVGSVETSGSTSQSSTSASESVETSAKVKTLADYL